MWVILDKVGYFFVKLFKAIKFAVVDYDSKMRPTKSVRQRIAIWLTIIGLTLLLLVVVFLVLKDVVLSLKK